MRQTARMLALAAIVLEQLNCAAGGSGVRYPSEGDPAPVGMELATDSTYGYAEDNPIRVGGVSRGTPENEYRYLGALRGPAGEKLEFSRQGSCCAFRTANGIIENQGLLDAFSVTYSGLAEPVTLYLNMYDYERPRVPVGFTQAR